MATIITLPLALADRAGTDTVLAAEDADGVMEVYATAEKLAAGERLKCFSMNDYAVLEGLFADARKLTATDDAATIRDADESHTADKGRGRFQVAHSRSAGVRCRPGRPW